jgi:hypothetical protein
LAGGALGLVGVRAAGAENDCSAFCQSLPPGRWRGECRSDCAHGTGLFFACDGNSAQLCLYADGSATCCPADQPCIDGACQGPPPGCTSDAECSDGNACTENICDTVTGVCSNPPIEGCIPCETAGQCDDGDDCTEDACVEGRCVNTAIPDCGAICTCPLKADGEPCVENDECCAGSCWQGFCGLGEVGCVDVGGYCAGGPCCSGICGEDCLCACLGTGDLTCTGDHQCCGGLCGPTGCCTEIDGRCTTNSDCCSGVCVDAGYSDENGPVFTCDRGPAGTPCRGDGACHSITCCEDVCCPENNFCGYNESTGEFSCTPYD